MFQIACYFFKLWEPSSLTLTTHIHNFDFYERSQSNKISSGSISKLRPPAVFLSSISKIQVVCILEISFHYSLFHLNFVLPLIYSKYVYYSTHSCYSCLLPQGNNFCTFQTIPFVNICLEVTLDWAQGLILPLCSGKSQSSAQWTRFSSGHQNRVSHIQCKWEKNWL